MTVMALVALLGLGLASVGTWWSAANQRDREQDLLRIGTLYAEAIASYRTTSPGSAKPYPPSLAQLTLDTRFVGTRRHLRKLYPDPLNPARPWGLIRAPDGGIKGIYSLDEREPFLRAPIQKGKVRLTTAQRYSDWKFAPEEAP